MASSKARGRRGFSWSTSKPLAATVPAREEHRFVEASLIVAERKKTTKVADIVSEKASMAKRGSRMPAHATIGQYINARTSLSRGKRLRASSYKITVETDDAGGAERLAKAEAEKSASKQLG